MCYIKKSFWDEKEGKVYFQELHIFNVSIEEPRIKRVKKIDLRHVLLFYKKLSIKNIRSIKKDMKGVLKLEQ